MPFVFLASQRGRRLPSDLASRGRPCLGLVVIFMYFATHEGEPPTGDLHPINSRPCRAYTHHSTRPPKSCARRRVNSSVRPQHCILSTGWTGIRRCRILQSCSSLSRRPSSLKRWSAISMTTSMRNCKPTSTKTLKLASSFRGQAGYANCGGPQRAEANVGWFARHLFCASRSGPHLDAYYLRQNRHGEHPGTHAPSDEKGD